MALTQADLDTLDAAIATGELKIEYNGRMVVFRSIPELIAARAHVKQVLTTPAVAATPRSQYTYHFSTARGD